MRIGELARELGVSADTLRFYERSGLLPRLPRAENGYREYGPVDVERIRLMLDLRRLDLSVADAARLAGWCQAGHCSDMSASLPEIIATRRQAIRERIEGLEDLDRRLAALESHLALTPLAMAAIDGPCCAAAAAVEDSALH
jgi:MerR family gold-responsive transcriptional activator of gol and ges genes